MKNKLTLVSLLLSMMACKNENHEHKTSEILNKAEVVEIDSVPGEKGRYVITEEIFWVIQEEPENHFDEAKEKFIGKELKAAGNEIQKASTYLDLEINKSEGTEKLKLRSAKDKLAALATRLNKGEKVTETEIKQSFYLANVALYKSYIRQHDNIQNSFASENTKIGMYLDAALQKVENSKKWSDNKLEDKYENILSEGKELSKRLKTDLKNDEKEASKEWKVFKEKLKALDERLEGNTNL